MTSKSAALLAACAMLAAPAGASPQDTTAPLATVVVGSRVRIFSPAYLTSVSGAVVALDGEAMTIAADGIGALRVPRETIGRIELSRGRSRRTLKGMVIGTAIGTFVGYYGYTPDAAGCASGVAACSRGESIRLVGGVGAALGAWIGHRIQRDQWQPITLDRVRVAVDPGLGGVKAMTVSVGF
jgi:hypothetical protein